MPLILAVVTVCLYNTVLLTKIWVALKAIDGTLTPLAFTIPVFLIACFNVTIPLLSPRPVFKPLFISWLILSAVISYAMRTYGIVFDKTMILNIAETNPHEAGSYLNLPLIAWCVGLGVVPALLLYMTEIVYPPLRRSVLQKTASVGVSLAVIAVIAVFCFQDYASFIRNNPMLRKEIVPTYAMDGVLSYFKKYVFVKPLPYSHIGLDAMQKDPDIGHKKELVVLVVGETQRSMNYELNGYNRPTNSFTKQEGVTSFPHVTSCGTATAVSVPCMFSNLTQAQYDKDKSLSRDNLLDIVKRSGVSVLWLDNDSGCKDVCRNVESVDLREKYKHDPEQCVGDGCHDSIVLAEFAQRLKTLPDTTGLVVLHIMGSHGPTYFNRYPASHRYFTPDCQRSDIQNCTHEELINTYDNTIRYSDYILASIIKLLKDDSANRNSALLFMSDHGESLGEKGIYLHGMPYAVAPDEQTHVPFLSWMSDGFAKDRALDQACIDHTLTRKTYSHDNLFHTVLGLLAIHADAYRADLDVFAPCVNGIPDQD